MTLQGEHIGLRALEPEDIGFLYTLENTPSLWEVSETIEPFSRNILQNYLSNSKESISVSQQLRLLIYAREDSRSLGFLDFYDYDSLNSRVGMGVVILEERGKGYGREAVNLATSYAFEVLRVHQVYAHIAADNDPSIRLFEAAAFVRSGVRRDWIRTSNGYKDQIIYQNIKHEKP